MQCFGKEATEKIKSLLANSTTVRLEKDPVGDTIDKYGRWLRYVYSGDVFVNAELVKQGYAYAYLNFPFSKSEEFKKYESEARDRKAGLWSLDACDGGKEKIASDIEVPDQKIGFWKRILRFLFSW